MLCKVSIHERLCIQSKCFPKKFPEFTKKQLILVNYYISRVYIFTFIYKKLGENVW